MRAHEQNRIAVIGIVVLSFLFLVALATPSFAVTKSEGGALAKVQPPAAERQRPSQVVSILRLVLDSVSGNGESGQSGQHGRPGEDPASPFEPPGKPPDRPPHPGPPPDPPGRPPDRPPDHSHGDR